MFALRNQVADPAHLPAQIEGETHGIRRALVSRAIGTARDFAHRDIPRLKRVHQRALAGKQYVRLPAALAAPRPPCRGARAVPPPNSLN